MIKKTLFAGMAIAVLAGSAAFAASQVPAKKQDCHIIVEATRSNKTLTDEGIANNQRQLLDSIRKYATSNFKVVSSYSEIANAIALSVNSDDVELIKAVPGVKSVTLNKLHWETTYPMDDDPVIDPEVAKKHYYGDDTNQSAVTMNKPSDSNDGEGTVIAILDNEFYFKGNLKDGTPGWHHETFSPLSSDVAMRFPGQIPERLSTHAYKWAVDNKKTDKTAGVEGSLYFNTKVPFYFDYGGETENYADDYKEDLDVVSEVSYHGSHVASIAAGNAAYKGIAPKAQLVCMKVFTNYKASAMDQKIGLGSSSGAYDIPILNALEDCMLLKVDGINMSLGSNLDDFDGDSITMKVLNQLATSGILTSISAGNSGKASYASAGAYANWTTDMVETGILGSYANSEKATIVAAGQPDQVFYKSAFKIDIGGGVTTNIAYDDQIINRENSDIEYSKEYRMEDLVAGDPTKSLDWIYVKGFGVASDYANIDVKGKIAITNRGSITFKEKYDNAIREGAIAVGIINNDPTATDFNFSFSFGDDFTPTAPCVHILFKDKGIFERQGSGTFQIIANEIADNDLKRTISTFSTDGVRFDLDMKPDVTAPGENIRGAIPPQNKDDKEYYRFNTYEFLSGTSMSAPNYAGAQSVVLSKEAKAHYARLEAIDKDKTMTSAQKKEAKAKENAWYEEYHNSVDMRIMSTATIMTDPVESPEDNKKVITSPRRQGAGMVDLSRALSTDVYLEGLDQEGNGIGKAKIALRNNADINSGKIALSFIAHNESEENREYSAKLTVMRPAIVKNNQIVTKEYNNRGDVEDIAYIYGLSYWVNRALPGFDPVPEERHGSDGFAHNDVINVTKDIEYYKSREDCINDVKTVFKQGHYFNSGDSVNAVWEALPTKDYQSTSNHLIDEVELGDVTISSGAHTVSVSEYNLSAEVKADIASKFAYGCYIEGYLTLTSKDGHTNLNIPYLGFYAGEGKTYESAPVVEPFGFERDVTEVYPSYLVNDIAKSLLGKDKADMSSTWVVGYSKPGDIVNTEAILQNDNNLTNLTGFHQIGVNPDGTKSDKLYVGNANYSNTMLVQQFVLRSVKTNYFTITSKSDNKEVYRSALEDMLFGSRSHNYELYKSHVDDSYLAAGYVSHRAYAQIPLYDEKTGIPFASGEYEVKFNYQLMGTGTWVSKAYTIVIDASAPQVRSVEDKGDYVRINIKENKLVKATVDRYNSEFTANGEGYYYIDITKEDLNTYLENNMNFGLGSGRLFLKLTDAAYGQMGIIIRFAYENGGYNFAKYVMVQYHSLTLQNDFVDDGENIKLVSYDPDTELNTEITIDDYVSISRGAIGGGEVTPSSKGCKGNVLATSVLLSSLALVGIIAIVVSKFYQKKRSQGGK